jgi:single-strand DNA-binding protein
MNIVTIIGNLGADPKTGDNFTRFSVATNRVVTREEATESEVEWHNVVCFGKLAENCAKFLTKGSQVGVMGRLETNKWTDSDGIERKSWSVVAREVQFLSTKGTSPDDSEGTPRSRRRRLAD